MDIEFCKRHGPYSLFVEVDECNDCNWIIPVIRKSAPKGTRVYHGVKSSRKLPSIKISRVKRRERKQKENG